MSTFYFMLSFNENRIFSKTGKDNVDLLKAKTGRESMVKVVIYTVVYYKFSGIRTSELK